jgi:hypothetical protein
VKLYADIPALRTRQLFVDAAVVLWTLAWIRAGVFIYDLIERLRAPGATIEGAGQELAGSAEAVGQNLEDVPVVGQGLQAAFETISAAGQALQRAGVHQQEAIHALALWLGVLVALTPIASVVITWLPNRVRWVREASAARRLRVEAGDLRLFALRALATQPLSKLRRASSQPTQAYERGHYEPLAALELERLGLDPGRLGNTRPPR